MYHAASRHFENLRDIRIAGAQLVVARKKTVAVGTGDAPAAAGGGDDRAAGQLGAGGGDDRGAGLLLRIHLHFEAMRAHPVRGLTVDPWPEDPRSWRLEIEIASRPPVIARIRFPREYPRLPPVVHLDVDTMSERRIDVPTLTDEPWSALEGGNITDVMRAVVEKLGKVAQQNVEEGPTLPSFSTMATAPSAGRGGVNVTI